MRRVKMGMRYGMKMRMDIDMESEYRNAGGVHKL